FVAGAIFSGFAMVQTLLLVARKVLGLENYITMFHIEAMNKIILLTGSIVGVAYLTEFFIAYYSGGEYEQYTFLNRFIGPHWWAGCMMYGCNVLMTQLMWFKSIRRNVPIAWVLSIVVNIGLWFTMFLLFVRVLPSIAMAEVKLILKSSSEQAKKKLLAHGNLDPEQEEFYKESLVKFDSVDITNYQKA